MDADKMTVGKVSCSYMTLHGNYRTKTMPSDKAKTVRIGTRFNGPYSYNDSASGEMRKTFPTLSNDDRLLQKGILARRKAIISQHEYKPSWFSKCLKAIYRLL